MKELKTIFNSKEEFLDEFRKDVSVELKAQYALYLVQMAYANGWNDFRQITMNNLKELTSKPKLASPCFKIVEEDL